MLDFQELQAEAERLEQQPGQLNDVLDKYVIFPKGDGAVTVRILPPYSNTKFYCATRTHRINERNIHCPKVLVGNKYVGECEICKYYNWLWKQSEEQKNDDERNTFQAKARAIKPVERYYYNCIVRSQVNPKTEQLEKNVGPKILSIGKGLHKMIVRAIMGAPEIDEVSLGDITDVEKGRDFKIVKRMVKSGREEYPQYNESKFLDSSVAGTKEQVDEWLSKLHNLAELRIIKSQEDLEYQLKLHLGGVKDDKNDFDPAKFQKEVSVEDKVRQESASNVVNTLHNKDVPPVVDNAVDDVMVEEEFLETIKSMK